MSFHQDRDLRGQPAEQILLELLRLQNIPARINPTPDPDIAPDPATRQQWYEDRAAYDLWVNGEYWDCKADWMSWQTGNICVEADSLVHTRSVKFAYILPNPSGLYVHVFDTKDLITLYNAQNRLPRGDGSFYPQYLYPHKRVGDQAENDAVLLPKDITNEFGRSLWQETREIIKQTA